MVEHVASILKSLESKLLSIEIQLADLKHSIHETQCKVEFKINSALTVDKKTCKINKFRDRLVSKVTSQLAHDVDTLKTDPSKLNKMYLRNVEADKYLSSIYLSNEGYFGRLLNEERLLITNLGALKFVKFLKFLNLDNSRKAQLKLEYISFLISKLDSNDHLESNCVSFEFLKNNNVLVNYKTMFGPNTTLRNLEMINSNSTMLYSARFLQPSVKFFKLKIDHSTNESIYILNRYKKNAEDYIFEVFNLRLELKKSFQIIDCIKGDFARCRSILDSEINDLILFTFHVYESELLISLKRRFKNEFFYLIYDLGRDNMSLKTVIGSFKKLDNTKKHVVDECIEIVNIDPTITSLITFTNECFFFVNERREMLIMSKQSGEVVKSLDFSDQSEIDFYFDYKAKQFAFFVQNPTKSKTTSNKNGMTFYAPIQQQAKFMVYSFGGEFLAENLFAINLLNKFYKVFFKSYFRTGLSTRVFFKYPTLNA
jgi:hypothetical protein